MLHDLSVIIPSFNGIEALQKTLEMLLSHSSEIEIIVVDGGSSDGSQQLALSLGVKLLEVENHGYGHNLNRGISASSGWFVVLMNSDVLMPRNTLSALIDQLEDTEVGAVGAVPLVKNGSRQQSFGLTYFPNLIQVRTPLEVNMLHGYCIATRRDVLYAVGGFDECFFFYNEEYDWCWRVAKAGYQLVLIPETATHLGGESTPNNSSIFVEGRRGGMYLIDKHFPTWIAEPTRRFFQLEAWLAQKLEKRIEFKNGWQKLETMMKSKNYLQSPYSLSGRGEVKFYLKTR
jgi:N-acetylglucosaminyl-diphospho-decaprenol L-rhamnosyltransferase